MKIVRIPKSNGKFRTLYCPDEVEMVALKKLAYELRGFCFDYDKHSVQHAFLPGRSPVTNAMAHKGKKYTMSFDLKDFFDTVTAEMLKNQVFMCHERFAQCFVDGAARQGLPTSPFIANIAASGMDDDFVAMGKRSSGRFDRRFVYTRYADDMTFSFDQPELIAVLRQAVPEIVTRHGFILNEAKTRVQCAKAGRRMITGVAVDDKIHVPRETRRKLRAARHSHSRPSQVHGLEEWCKLKVPKGYQEPEKDIWNMLTSTNTPVAVKSAANQAPAAIAHVLQPVHVTRKRFIEL